MEPMVLGTPDSSPTSPQYLPAYFFGEYTSKSQNILSPKTDRLHFGNVTSRAPLSGILIKESDWRTKPKKSVRFGPPKIDLFDDIIPIRVEAGNEISQSFLNNGNSGKNESNIVFENHDYRLSPSSAYEFRTNNTGHRSTDNISQPTSMMPWRYTQSHDFANNNSTYHPASALPHKPYQLPILHSRILNSNYILNDTWITVFGFPPALLKEVVDMFRSIGIPKDIDLKPLTNYVSILYETSHEVKQAMNVNGTTIKPGVIIGVMLCADPRQVEHNNSYVPNECRFTSKTSRASENQVNNSGASQISKVFDSMFNKAVEFLWNL